MRLRAHPILRAAAVSLAAICPPAAMAQAEVDVALVLAVDISFSIGAAEQDIQRRGYAAAFRDPEVVSAITGGLNGRIAVAYLEWAGGDAQHLITPWTLIDGAETASRYADLLEAAAPHRAGRTSISLALRRGAELLASAPYVAARRIIDISGDGANNDGPQVLPVRDAAIAQGITINALPIMAGPKELRMSVDGYYRDCVIGGPGAFALPVHHWDAFADAIRRKMILEISDLRPDAVARVWTVAATDCLIGEKLARREYIEQLDALTSGRSERWAPREEDWPTPE